MNDDQKVIWTVFLQASGIIAHDRGSPRYRERVFDNLLEIAQRVDDAYARPPGWTVQVNFWREHCSTSTSLAQFSPETRIIWKNDLERFYDNVKQLETIANG